MKICIIVYSKYKQSGHALPLSGTLGLWGACPACTLIKKAKARPGATRLYNPLCRSVRRSVRPSHFTFLVSCGLWPYCSCPNDGVASNMAPAHPHATWVAVYPALLKRQPMKEEVGKTVISQTRDKERTQRG